MRRTSVTATADEAWVRAAYSAYGAELFRLANRSLGDRELAEEAVQDTFLKAWRSRDRFDATLGSERTWLFAIMRNTIIDLSRARGVRPQLPPRLHHEGSTPSIEAQVDRLIEAWLVEEAMNRLSKDHRDALAAVHGGDRDYQSAAEEMGIPPGTLKSRVYYGLKALRLALEELGWTDDE